MYRIDVTPVSIEQKAGWAPKPIWKFGEERKYILVCLNSKPGPFSRSTSYYVNYVIHSSTALVGQGLFKLRFSVRHATDVRTPLDEGSARRRDLYLTSHNTYRRQTSVLLAGFKLALERSATGIGKSKFRP